ncbi:MAG: serine--tRNA ligase [Candidatus Aenigmatarchaeota archaeon]
MLDIRLIRENPDIVRKDLKKRGDAEKLKLLEELMDHDREWRKMTGDVEKLRARRNSVTGDIAKLKKEGSQPAKQLSEMKEIKSEIETLEEKVGRYELHIKDILMRLPNILHESVPVGKDDSENVEVRKWGKIQKADFKIGHEELGLELNLLDIERAAKISGARFYFLKGELALLEMAIMKCAIDFMARKGYQLVIPPHMMRRKPYEGVTDLSDFGEMLYKIENEDLYMIATSEHPLTARFMDETIEEGELPIRNAGFSTNFRKEAGAHGKDTKGIFRVHQFNKVEQIVFCKPEDSWKIHEELICNAEEFFKMLEIPFRIVNICTGDIGTVAAKKYDLEAWMPVQQKYREMVSCSNCTDYQARRLNIKFRGRAGEASKGFLHTLNSTVVTDRALVAIMENFQQKDGSIMVPKVLQPYMNGMKKIEKK